jgi:IS30 family transposase
VLIDHRPAIVDQGGRVGDWKGDLIVGRSSRSAIGTLVDRASRYARLIHLPPGTNAEQVHAALGPVLEDLPEVVLRTLTWDQGSEMAHHQLLANHFRDGVFFAHPASPWQR